ncbi:hypothetical protein PQX77_005077 [Marasmius sp. AFHP31]|nr:hypothetical protein PQX77_005077 [Marasmius sp. AFHP31]
MITFPSYALIAAVGVPLFLLLIRSRRRSLKFLQGPPSPSILLGHEYALVSEAEDGDLEFGWFERYGTAFKAKGCFNEDVLMVADPLALQHIFQKTGYRYRKAREVELQGLQINGPGLFAVQGESHQRQRKLLNPAFSVLQTQKFCPIFQNSANTLVRKWKNGLKLGPKVFNVLEWLPNMALDALGESVFEYDFGAAEDKHNELATLVEELFVDSHFLTPGVLLYIAAIRAAPNFLIKLSQYLPSTKEQVRWKKWRATAYATAEAMYEKRMREAQGSAEMENDVLGVVCRALESSNPEKMMHPEEASAQLATMIMAGHETTALTMTWIIYELSRHPEDQHRILEEVKRRREETRNEGELTPQDYNSMSYLGAVIKEALRLYPILSTIPVEAEVDDVIPLEYPVVSSSGHVIREVPVAKDQRVIASVDVYNRLKEVWGEDAHEWRPTRFLEDKTQTTLGVYGNVFTFGAGARACIGSPFLIAARTLTGQDLNRILEVQAVIVTLLEAFELSLPKEGLDIMRAKGIIMRPVIRGQLHEGQQMPILIKNRDSD